MKTLSILFWFLFSLTSWGQSPKVVMLTSLMDTKLLNRSTNAKLEKAIEKSFTENFKMTSLEIEVHHLTTPKTLWQILNDETVVGIFWVSHAKEGRPITDSLTDPGTVRDAFGNDVKKFFKRTTPNLKFLGLIGCEGEAILREFQTQNLYHPDLALFSFPKKVDALKGLKAALKASKNISLSGPLLSIDASSSSFSLDFIKTPTPAPASSAIMVEISQEIVGIIPGNESTASIEIPEGKWDAFPQRNIKLTALKDSTGIEVVAPYELRLNSVKALWKAFGKNGIPAGTAQNLYLWSVSQ